MPEENQNVDASMQGKDKSHEEQERQQKMELFVRESFEAKDELCPEKPSLIEELPVEVSGQTEDQEPGVLLLGEALKPATPRATCKGKELGAA